MTKSLLAGMAVCAALAVFSGNASAYVERTPGHTEKVAPARSPSLASLRAKGGPLHDCVHITFPQCDRGYGEPND
jgi:hypothetical protein